MNPASSRATDRAVLSDSEAVAEILQVRDAWVKARDIDRLVSLVTDDVVLVYPNRTVTGKAALRADFQRSCD